MKRILSNRFIPLKYKLMASYFVFSLLPVIVVGSISYHASVKAIQQQTENNLQGTLTQIRENIVYKQEDVKRLSEQLYKDYNLQIKLLRLKEGWSSYETTTNYLIPTLESIMKMNRYNVLLEVYISNEAIPEVYGNRDPDIDHVNDPNRFDLLHLSRLDNTLWYKNLHIPTATYGYDFIWEQVDTDVRFNQFSLIRRWIDFDSGKNIGLLRTVVNISDLLDVVDHNKIGAESSLFVYDDHGKQLKYSSNSSGNSGDGVTLRSMKNIANNDQYLRLEEEIPDLNWKLVALIPNSILLEKSKIVKQITIFVCLASASLLFVMGIFISRYFSSRVNRIVKSMNAVRSGDFNQRIEFHSRDEFAQIANAFNRMGKDIDQLIEEVYVANLQKKEAELEALQSQINPHFLYNTLSSISRLAQFGEMDKLHQMVMGLAKFYRLTLNEGRTIINVSNELEQVQTYIEIQKIKYRERLDIIYDFEPGVHKYTTIKLILQPFVENILIHAWYGDRIGIKVAANRENGMIVFRIIDNGVGIDRNTLDQITNSNGVQVGYGIRNVDERIKLQYGGNYGVTLYSRPGIGTTVQITIPEIATGLESKSIV